MNIHRCHWCGKDSAYIEYHDQEWGVPVFDEQVLFEFLCLEGMQAGLSWITILKKREHMRQVFAGFDPVKLARFSASRVDKLLQDPGIIRHQGKINAMINNAKVYLRMKSEKQSFVDFLWQFTGGETIQNHWKVAADIPASTPASKSMAKHLKKLGFNFVGETICYAFMQAVGMVNDHTIDCYRHDELS